MITIVTIVDIKISSSNKHVMHNRDELKIRIFNVTLINRTKVQILQTLEACIEPNDECPSLFIQSDMVI